MAASETPKESAHLRRTRQRLEMYKGVPTEAPPKRSKIKLTAVDLRTATEVPAAMIAKNVAEVTSDQLGAYMDELGTGGVFRSKIAGAASFGFVKTGPERVTLTDLGVRAVNPETRIRAWRQAVMNVPLYRQLVEKYSREPVPDEVRLEEEVVRMGVVPAGAQKARWMFLRSVDQAEMLPRGHSTLISPAEIEQDAPKTVVPPRESRVVPLEEAEATYAARARRYTSLELPPDPFADFDPLVAGLLRRLPKKGEKWSPEEVARWLRAAEMNFGLVWGDDLDSRG